MKGFALFLLIASANALIEWPFKNEYANLLNLTIGTPGQSFQLVLSPEWYNPGILIPSLNADPKGFDLNASSTFQQTGVDLDYQNKQDGVIGTETFVIENLAQDKLTGKTLTVLDTNWYGSIAGNLALTRATDGSTNFVQEILNESEEQVAVIVFNYVKPDYTQSCAGTLTLGGRPQSCSSDWTYVPETIYQISSFTQWAVEIDSLEAGKYKSATPGQALISWDTPSFSLPQTTFLSVLSGVGSTAYGTVPCDSKIDIVFTIGGIEFRVKPQDYTDYSKQETTGICSFMGHEVYGSDNYVLPNTILRNRCLLLDFENKRLGFAKKGKQ